MNQIMGYLTFSDQNEAQKICSDLVEKKLIACANILPNHTAIYSWQNKIESISETAAIIKTMGRHVETIESYLNAHHSYECPGFVTWSLDNGHSDFLEWINQQTKSHLDNTDTNGTNEEE